MYKALPKHLLALSMTTASLFGAVTLSGCHKGVDASTATPDNSGTDPADANLAPVDNSQPQQTAAAPAPSAGAASRPSHVGGERRV